VGQKDNLDAIEKRKFSLPCLESNPHSLINQPFFVTTLTELVSSCCIKATKELSRIVILRIVKSYRVIQEESAIFCEMIVCVILSKKVHINMCPIFDGYGVMGIF
jgi:hypothetical protein